MQRNVLYYWSTGYGENLLKSAFCLDHGEVETIAHCTAAAFFDPDVDCVLDIEVEDQKIVDRMSGRRVCLACGATHHVLYNPPKESGICDKCGAELTIRKDDAPETVLSRLETYHAITEPLKEYYSKKGLLVIVEGQEKVEDTTALVNAALSRFSK